MLSDSNLLFLVFQLLDEKSLLRCSQVCKQWNECYNQYPKTLWKSLCSRQFETTELYDHKDYKQLYQSMYNIHHQTYKFICGEEEFRYNNESVNFDSVSGDLKKPYFVWPCLKINTYLVAMYKDMVLWIDHSMDYPVTEIYGARLGKELTMTPDFTLRGHAEHLGLLLTNGEGMLLAFDQTSLVYLWDLDTLELKGSIDSTDTLESIVSMNTDKDYFIAGGSNSTVAIWNIYTRQLVKVLPKEIIKSEARNVGICGNTIVFAVCDGTFHVHDFDTLQERFVLNILDAAKLSVPFVAEIFGQESVESVENDQVAEESDGEFTLENAIENGGFTPFFTEQEFVPTVLSLNSHVLLTNGCGNGNLEESSDVLLWDLKTGKLICSLSENIAMEKYSLVARDADPIRVAEITKDGTMIYSSVDQIQDCCRLLVWDFCSIERNVVANRASLCAVGSVMPIQVWVVSPEL